jgi:hypothetical protein
MLVLVRLDMAHTTFSQGLMGNRVELKCDPATGMTRVGTALEQGTVKIFGETHFAWGEIVGIELDD